MLIRDIKQQLQFVACSVVVSEHNFNVLYFQSWSKTTSAICSISNADTRHQLRFVTLLNRGKRQLLQLVSFFDSWHKTTIASCSSCCRGTRTRVRCVAFIVVAKENKSQFVTFSGVAQDNHSLLYENK